MNDKFKKTVRKPEQTAAKIRRSIQNLDTEMFLSNKMDDQIFWYKVIKPILDGLKITGIAFTGLSQFSLWATRFLLLDNPGIEKLSELYSNMGYSNSKLKNAVKENSDLSGHMTYYFLVLMLFASVYLTASIDKTPVKEKKNNKKEVAVKKKKVIPKTIDPGSVDFYEQCKMLEDGALVAIIYAETYREIPKQQYDEDVYTIGFGLTWDLDKNGNLIRNYVVPTKGEPAHKPTPKNMDEGLEIFRAFMKRDVYPKIKRHVKRPITPNEFYALCIALYQTPSHDKYIGPKLTAAKTSQEIADAFIAGLDQMKKGWGGTINRRWICGAMASGEIDLKDILNCYTDGFFAARENVFYDKKNKSFRMDAKTVDYMLNVKQLGKHKKTIEYINELKIRDDLLAIAGAEEIDFYKTEKKDDIGRREKRILNAANTAYAEQDYDKAADKFEKLTKMKNATFELNSSLVLSLYKQGSLETSNRKKIKIYKEGIEAFLEVRDKILNDSYENIIVNASLNYNAAKIYSELGLIYENDSKKTEAVANYTFAIKACETAKDVLIANAFAKKEQDKINIYNDMIKSLKASLKRVEDLEQTKMFTRLEEKERE